MYFTFSAISRGVVYWCANGAQPGLVNILKFVYVVLFLPKPFIFLNLVFGPSATSKGWKKAMVSLKQAVTYPSCATRVLVRHVNDRSVPTIRSIRRNGSNDLWIVTEKIVFSIIDQIVGVSVVVDFSFGFRRQADKGLFLLWIKHAWTGAWWELGSRYTSVFPKGHHFIFLKKE